MTAQFNRREAMKTIAAASAAAMLPCAAVGASSLLVIAGQQVEVQITSISPHTLRLTLAPIRNGKPVAIASDGSLVQTDGKPVLTWRERTSTRVSIGEFNIEVVANPLTFTIASPSNALFRPSAQGGKNGLKQKDQRLSQVIQRFALDEQTGALSFATGDAPLLGLGEGGPQFDRRGSVDNMKSGQGAYKLATHGGRVPIPWIISTSGWAMFLHQPYGTFDFTASESKLQPIDPGKGLPLDLFFVTSKEPAVIMSEYARLTGHPELPPLWSFGYQQSHRTLASREEVLEEAKTFRDKKLPCDALIYLGTGFCPSGWNTENGSFAWNQKVFPDPKEMMAQLDEHHFKVVLHSVIMTDELHGTVHDQVKCSTASSKSNDASCNWGAHREDFAMGVDGWWPDEGDPLDIPSRLVRNRMYWEGPQIDRPNERPYALHRNGYAGMQRYASFLWSGDVYSTWETLRNQIPIGINTGLSGIPYWGTDIGGFVPTKEFTAELYLRWFQYGAFCPLFRCHGRNWKLRLPWGWSTGDPGPIEIKNYEGAAIPDVSQLHNAQVEPICRKYLELRYRMLPYIYSAVRECTQTGLPIMRSLWLHYPEDPQAATRSDEYLWGRDVLVAPVVEPGVTSRSVYLPDGTWFDFWTNERFEGPREITRVVDLETMPLFVRGGAILPLGRVKQYVDEKLDEPLMIKIYPDGDGKFLLYEDDGRSFNYRRGEWMGIDISWSDAGRVLRMQLPSGSKMLPPLRRTMEIQVGDRRRQIEFAGHSIEVRF